MHVCARTHGCTCALTLACTYVCISIAPLQVHVYSEALPTQHEYCAGVSRRSATGNCELRTCQRSLRGGIRFLDPPVERLRLYQCATTSNNILNVLKLLSQRWFLRSLIFPLLTYYPMTVVCAVNCDAHMRIAELALVVLSAAAATGSSFHQLPSQQSESADDVQPPPPLSNSNPKYASVFMRRPRYIILEHSVCICLSICLSLCLSLYLITLFLSLCGALIFSLYLSVCLSVCLSLSLSLSPLSPYPISVCLSTLSHYPLSMSVCLSVSFSLCLSHSLSLYSLYLCLSVSQSVCFYIIYRYIFLYIIYYFKISAQPAPSIHLSDDEYMDRRLSMGR